MTNQKCKHMQSAMPIQIQLATSKSCHYWQQQQVKQRLADSYLTCWAQSLDSPCKIQEGIKCNWKQHEKGDHFMLPEQPFTFLKSLICDGQPVLYKYLPKYAHITSLHFNPGPKPDGPNNHDPVPNATNNPEPMPEAVNGHELQFHCCCWLSEL